MLSGVQFLWLCLLVLTPLLISGPAGAQERADTLVIPAFDANGDTPSQAFSEMGPPALASSPFATPAHNLWLADGPPLSPPVTRPQSLSA